MTVVMDQRDLQILDESLRFESKMWDVLQGGANMITPSDFLDAETVRVNKMDGFVKPSQYNRNGENSRSRVDMEKEVFKLSQEDWFSYTLDKLDQTENMAYNVQNIVTGHRKQITIPERDKYAAQKIFEVSQNGGKLVEGTIDTKNALAAYDDAEAYMVDNEVPGGFVMFASSSFYKSLKNADGVSKTFTTNEASINGINRKVGQLDDGVPILQVPKGRLQGRTISDTHDISFMLVPLYAFAPVVKLETVDYIPAELDPTGYRDTIKSLSFYDIFSFDNTKKGVYVAASKNSTTSK
ncbi:hypothetical protein [Limosilactobacillus equigenerosi]|nr:hypothetical protein [Limosilactobacillus equigenerosi]